MRRDRAPVRGTRSTLVVLLLMILIVFVPIAAVHGLARLLGAAPAHSEVVAPRRA